MSERSLYKTITRLGVSLALILGPNFARASAQASPAQAADLPNGHILFTSPEPFMFAAHIRDPECNNRPEGCYFIGDSTRFELDPESYDSIRFTTFNGSSVLLQDHSDQWDYRQPANVWHPADINHTVDPKNNQLTWSWRPFQDEDPANNPDLLIIDINLPPGVTSSCPTREEIFSPDDTVRNCEFSGLTQDSQGFIEFRELSYPELQTMESGRIDFALTGQEQPTPIPTASPTPPEPTPTPPEPKPEPEFNVFLPLVVR